MNTMAKQETQLRWSDTWLLLSIYYASASAPARLSDIIGAADFINHAIMNFDELNSGLARLSDISLIEIDSTQMRFSCSSKIIRIIEPIKKTQKSIRAVWNMLERQLEAEPWMPGTSNPHPLNIVQHAIVAEHVYQEAVAKYLEKMKVKKGRK